MKVFVHIVFFVLISSTVFSQNAKKDLEKIASKYAGIKNTSIQYVQEFFSDDFTDKSEKFTSGKMIFNSSGNRYVKANQSEVFEWDNQYMLVDNEKKEVALFSSKNSGKHIPSNPSDLFKNIDQFLNGCSEVRFSKLSNGNKEYSFIMKTNEILKLVFDKNYYINKLSVGMIKSKPKSNVKEEEITYQISFTIKEATKQDLESADRNRIIRKSDKNYVLTAKFKNYRLINLQ